MSLTEEQKSTILREWESNQDDPPSLLELIRKAYPDNLNIDGRSKEGKEVKARLSSIDGSDKSYYLTHYEHILPIDDLILVGGVLEEKTK